jgi:hypothetical protein
MKLYRYVGPTSIRDRMRERPGIVIENASDFNKWCTQNSPELLADDSMPVTFVIDVDGKLRIADRRSEHVACAGGGDVLSAGEMFFAIEADNVRVVEASNQSTGYCPEPESWPAVEAALDAARIRHPGRFTQAIVFRRCVSCGQRNIVKNSDFRCGHCERELPTKWNFET